MLEDIEVLFHSSIRINKGKVIYVDPYKVNQYYSDADYIFITHSHYDHLSEIDINKVRKDNTKIIAPEDSIKQLLNMDFKEENIITVEPNEQDCLDDIIFETIPAYNVKKTYHPKENGWVGYIIEIQGVRYYIAGDTDVTEENRQVKCDIAFVPVGGTFTMDYKEAATLVNEINPKIAIPTHYGSVVGTPESAEKFIGLLNSDITGIILMK